METQNILDTEIGTEDYASHNPARVKIVETIVEPVINAQGKMVGNKLTCQCKHPENSDLIGISSVKFEQKGGKLKTSGLWVSLDKEEKLQKGSALVHFLMYMKVSKISLLNGKEVDAILDENNYLCFKAY